MRTLKNEVFDNEEKRQIKVEIDEPVEHINMLDDS
jgi:hypothetical protein